MTFKYVTALSIVTILSGCNNDSSSSGATSVAVTPSIPTKPVPGNTELADRIDEMMLSQISRSATALMVGDIWQGYGSYYSSSPKYVLKMDGRNANKAFLVNPKVINDGYEQLGANENQGLKVYRYDRNMDLAKDKLYGSEGNGSFEFYYQFEGSNYYLQNYEPAQIYYSEFNMEVASFIALHVHESFHVFQDRFTIPHGAAQDFDNYPVNQDQLTSRLMLLNAIDGLPKQMSKEEAKALLKVYVALTQEQIEKDQTGLVKKMGTYQEWLEGAPMYVDTMVVRRILEKAKDRKFNYMPLLENIIAMANSPESNKEKTKQAIDSYFKQGIFYETGSAAIWLLKTAGYPVTDKIEQGITPFEAAKSFVGNFDNDAFLQEYYRNTKEADNIKKLAEKLASY
jgi:hypothetical protein